MKSEQSLDTLFKQITPGEVSEVMMFLIRNNLIRLTDFTTKFRIPIPFDFRIDQACTGATMLNIGERMADKFIEIEKDLDVQFDSMLCSLYSGIFGGTSTAIWLQKKYNRNINVAVSRRSYKQQTIHPKLSQSIHPLKNADFAGKLTGNVLIHDEMTNTGDTIRELITICKNNGSNPTAIMIMADRILDPLPPGIHVRMYDQVPCYSLITHYEIVEWCKNNPEIWKSLNEPS